MKPYKNVEKRIRNRAKFVRKLTVSYIFLQFILRVSIISYIYYFHTGIYEYLRVV